METDFALKQLGERSAFLHQMERPAFAVGGVEVVDAHRVEDGPGDVFGSHTIVSRVSGAAVAGAVDLTAPDAAAGHEDRHAVRPMIAVRFSRASAARAKIAQLRRSSR